MSKKTDMAKVHEIIKHGFTLPAEIEAFFVEAKKKMVEGMLKKRSDIRKDLADFAANAEREWNEMPSSDKTVRDGKFENGKFITFTRPLRYREWYSKRYCAIQREYPFYGRSDEDAIKLTEDACDFKRIQFIIRTNGITGDNITSCALHIDAKSGDVNGTITGGDGTARVQTISAGGWNIQCYHFRVLVRAA